VSNNSPTPCESVLVTVVTRHRYCVSETSMREARSIGDDPRRVRYVIDVLREVKLNHFEHESSYSASDL